MSRPCAAMAASVKRSASAPYSSISSSGSMTLPLDFDIFCPLLVAHQRVDVDRRGTAPRCMKCRPIIIMRATQKKMMSKPVTSTLVG